MLGYSSLFSRVYPRKPNDCFNQIINVSEISAHPTISINVNGIPFQNGFNKLDRSHVRPSRRPVYGKEPKGSYGEAVNMRVAMGKYLDCLLGCRVECKWLIRATMF